MNMHSQELLKRQANFLVHYYIIIIIIINQHSLVIYYSLYTFKINTFVLSYNSFCILPTC